MPLTPIKNAYLVEGTSSGVFAMPSSAKTWMNLDTGAAQSTAYFPGRDYNTAASLGDVQMTLTNPSIVGNAGTDTILVYSIPVSGSGGASLDWLAAPPVIKITFGGITWPVSVHMDGTPGGGQLIFNIPTAAWNAGLLVEVDMGTARLGYYWLRNSTAAPASSVSPVDHYAYPAAAALGQGSVLLSYDHITDPTTTTTLTSTTTASWDTSWKVNGVWTTGARTVRASTVINGPADLTITVGDPVAAVGGGYQIPYTAVPDDGSKTGVVNNATFTVRGPGNVSASFQTDVTVGSNHWTVGGLDYVDISFFLYQSPFLSDVQLYTVPPGILTFTTTTTTTTPAGFAAFRTRTNVLTLGTDGYRVGRQVELARPRIKAATLAPATGNRVLALYEAEPDDTASGGYQLLRVDNDVATVADTAALPTPGRYTISSGPTAVLSGNDTFFVQRITSLADGTHTADTPQASIDLITMVGTDLTRTAVADTLDRTGLLGIVPIDATTAYAAAAVSDSGGTTLRMYRLDTSGSVTTTDLTLPLLAQTPIYTGVNGEYPVEILTQGTISGTLARYGIRYSDGAFTATQLPLDQIDRTFTPPGVTASTTTRFDTAAYVPVNDQLFVVRYASTGLTENTWLRISQYDGTSGALVAEAWTGGLLTDGRSHYNLTTAPPATFYDPDNAQLGVAVTEWRTAYATNAIRLATFQVEGYVLNEALRSQATNFL